MLRASYLLLVLLMGCSSKAVRAPDVLIDAKAKALDMKIGQTACIDWIAMGRDRRMMISPISCIVPNTSTDCLAFIRRDKDGFVLVGVRHSISQIMEFKTYTDMQWSLIGADYAPIVRIEGK